MSASVGDEMLIDINTCFGMSPTRRVRKAQGVAAARMVYSTPQLPETTQDVDWSLDNLLGIMDKYGVDRACTYSLRGKLYEFISGNEETWSAAERHPRLIPVATINPQRHFGCLEEVERCADSGFFLFRFFPDEQSWDIGSLPFLRLCEALAEWPVAVMLPAGAWGQQTRTAELLCQFGFPVVAMGATFTTVAESIAVAAKHDNFFCETSMMHMADTIEGFVSEAGADSLIFGSDSPASYFASAYGLVNVARISKHARNHIMGGNATDYLLCGEHL